MAKKLVFFFGGTGDDGSGVYDYTLKLADDVIRVHVAGCQTAEMGGGFIFPDLDEGASRIRRAFNDKGMLSVSQLQQLLGSALARIEPMTDELIEVESIALTGFSRGAVSAFACARHLDDLTIPLHIIANQPVPGNSELAKERWSSEYRKNCDLSHCKHIQAATTLIGAYSNDNGFIENTFFKQMMAKMPDSTVTQAYLLPFQQHLQWFYAGNRDIVMAHIGRHLASYGFSRQDELYFSKYLQKCYFSQSQHYTPLHSRQAVLGETTSLEQDPFYGKQMIVNAKYYLETWQQQHKLDAVVADFNQLTPAQAMAIAAIDELNEKQPLDLLLPSLVSMSLANDERSNQFCQLLAMINHGCHCLQKALLRGERTKLAAVKRHSISYQLALFEAIHQYLKIDQPSCEQTEHFKQQLQQAEDNFIERAAGIHQNSLHPIIAGITNAILLILSLPCKLVTGEWLVPSTSRSAQRTALLTNSIFEHSQSSSRLEPQAVATSSLADR